MRKPRTLTVDLSDSNGTRWTNWNWLQADLGRITDVSGTLPANHLTQKIKPYEAFSLWLAKTVKPETAEWIMATENAFVSAYAAYRSLAEHQANKLKKNHNSEAKPAESTTNV